MRAARLPTGLLAALLSLASPTPGATQASSGLDEPLCPDWIEGMLFDSYRSAANRGGRPEKRWPGVAFEDQSFAAADGTRIYGYRALAEGEPPPQRPAVVIVLGNAMLADQLHGFAAWFALQGFTAYVFDHRGYGGSLGTPRSNALIKDFREILGRVAAQDHSELAVYAMSFGGVISLAALADASPPDALVLDGVPSTLPWYAFCPAWVDPVSSVAHAPERTLVISGTADPVVPAAQMAPLRARAEELGMQSRVVEGFSHPGIDDAETTLRRLELVRDFLRGPTP